MFVLIFWFFYFVHGYFLLVSMNAMHFDQAKKTYKKQLLFKKNKTNIITADSRLRGMIAMEKTNQISF
jgi:hypothetical protein